MARMNISLSSKGEEHHYKGYIKLAGMPQFDFGTKAVSDKKAKSNGLAQFAKRLNMSIAQLNMQLKRVQHEITVSLDDERGKK